VPVTDEALTQCIRTLRRQLGDDAGNPRLIETVHKHGYRFIAPVERLDDGDPPAAAAPAADAAPAFSWPQLLGLGGAAAVGGGFAGIFGGLLYGFGGASQPLQPGMGAISVLLVLICLCILVGATGGAGVGLGAAAAGLAARRRGPWIVVGAAGGGLVVGALAKLLGLDAFSLLVGRSPGDITGGGEGLLLGAAVGLAAWLGSRGRDAPALRRSVAAAALAGAAAGVVIALAGGRLMGGSLDLLAGSFPDSRLRLDQIGAWFGEAGFGPLTRLVTGAVEGAIFCGFVVAAMILARRSWGGTASPLPHISGDIRPPGA
jgi:hypothetical protein